MGLAMRAGMKQDLPLVYGGIRSYWKQFSAGYQRERGEIPAAHITTITRVSFSSGQPVSHSLTSQMIQPRGILGKELNIIPEKGQRRHMTAMHFEWIGEFLWTHDWKIFARPRTRVDVWALLSLSAYTCARVSDYIESSARYKSGTGLYYKVRVPATLSSDVLKFAQHAELIVFRNESGESEFALQSTKFLKGKNPQSSKL